MTYEETIRNSEHSRIRLEKYHKIAAKLKKKNPNLKVQIFTAWIETHKALSIDLFVNDELRLLWDKDKIIVVQESKPKPPSKKFNLEEAELIADEIISSMS